MLNTKYRLTLVSLCCWKDVLLRSEDKLEYVKLQFTAACIHFNGTLLCIWCTMSECLHFPPCFVSISFQNFIFCKPTTVRSKTSLYKQTFYKEENSEHTCTQAKRKDTFYRPHRIYHQLKMNPQTSQISGSTQRKVIMADSMAAIDPPAFFISWPLQLKPH